MLQHEYDQSTQNYVKTNVCEHAALVGNDGVFWAVSSEWPGLNNYTHVYEENGEQKSCEVNELKHLHAIASGNRSPQECGIRLFNDALTWV